MWQRQKALHAFIHFYMLFIHFYMLFIHFYMLFIRFHTLFIRFHTLFKCFHMHSNASTMLLYAFNTLFRNFHTLFIRFHTLSYAFICFHMLFICFHTHSNTSTCFSIPKCSYHVQKSKTSPLSPSTYTNCGLSRRAAGKKPSWANSFVQTSGRLSSQSRNRDSKSVFWQPDQMNSSKPWGFFLVFL